jgi:hypothetical protein
MFLHDFWNQSKAARLFYLLGTARVVTVLCGICILLMLKRQQYLARRGSVRAARALLLPIYEPMIIMYIASLMIEWAFLFLAHRTPWLEFVCILAMWSINSFTETGLIIFFCSHSLSQPSMMRSLWFAFGWGIIGFICALVHELYGKLVGQLLFNALPIVLFIIILRKGIYRRRSVVPAVQFMLLYRMVRTRISSNMSCGMLLAVRLVSLSLLTLSFSVFVCRYGALTPFSPRRSIPALVTRPLCWRWR